MCPFKIKIWFKYLKIFFFFFCCESLQTPDKCALSLKEIGSNAVVAFSNHPVVSAAVIFHR